MPTQKNGLLVAGVAAVAVAAVVVGGVVAYGQGTPLDQAGSAAPLAGASKTPTPPALPKPSGTPTAGSTSVTRPPVSPPTGSSPKPSRKPSGAVKSKVELAKLPVGRNPQIAYRVGREIRGGAGAPVRVPGKDNIADFVRVGQAVLVTVIDDRDRWTLLRIRSSDVEQRTADVRSLVSAPGNGAAAYAAHKPSLDETGTAGGTIYAYRDGLTGESRLDLKTGYEPEVLGYVNGKVYFSSRPTYRGNDGWQLYSWTPGQSRAVLVSKSRSPIAVSADGRLVSELRELTDSDSCSSVSQIANGKQLWRTCDYMVRGFTPDGATAIIGSAYSDGYADGIAGALDAGNGNLIREWSGTFRQAVPEDDQHVLLLADDGEGTKAAIIRCAIPTGICERATPLALADYAIGE